MAMDAVFKNTFFVSRKSIIDKAWESSGPWTRSKIHPNKHSPFSAGILDTELNKEELVQRRERRNASPKYWWRGYCMYGEYERCGACYQENPHAPQEPFYRESTYDASLRNEAAREAADLEAAVQDAEGARGVPAGSP